MTIQEILEAHETYNAYITEGYGVGVDCKCGANVRRAGIKVVEAHRAHVAEVLDKRIHEQAPQAQVNVLKGVASAWEEMDGPGPTRTYARMLRETAQRISKEAHDAGSRGTCVWGSCLLRRRPSRDLAA